MGRSLSLFPQLCPGTVIISTDLDHCLSHPLTALSANISMQTDAREGKWSCNPESCGDAVAVITDMRLQSHILGPM